MTSKRLGQDLHRREQNGERLQPSHFANINQRLAEFKYWRAMTKQREILRENGLSEYSSSNAIERNLGGVEYVRYQRLCAEAEQHQRTIREAIKTALGF